MGCDHCFIASGGPTKTQPLTTELPEICLTYYWQKIGKFHQNETLLTEIENVKNFPLKVDSIETSTMCKAKEFTIIIFHNFFKSFFIILKKSCIYLVQWFRVGKYARVIINNRTEGLIWDPSVKLSLEHKLSSFTDEGNSPEIFYGR